MSRSSATQRTWRNTYINGRARPLAETVEYDEMSHLLGTVRPSPSSNSATVGRSSISVDDPEAP